jgi:internalin A
MKVFHKFITTMVLLSLLIVLFPAVAQADETVTFPDPNLEAAIRDAIAKPSGDILISDLLVLIDFYAQAKGINNLSGLEYCTNLQWLYLDDNQINDISTLQYLTNLRVLGLTGNQISDVSPLQNLLQLWPLYLTDNQISDNEEADPTTEIGGGSIKIHKD